MFEINVADEADEIHENKDWQNNDLQNNNASLLITNSDSIANT